MHRTRPLLPLVLALVASIGVVGYTARLRAAPIAESPPRALAAPADAPLQSMPADEGGQSKIEINPATDRAVPCSCSSAGSGCAGACPNAPGPKRYCKNTAPAGKPKMCACI